MTKRTYLGIMCSLLAVAMMLSIPTLAPATKKANPNPEPTRPATGPKPSLEWFPDDAEGCSPEGWMYLCNTSKDVKDVAAEIVITVEVEKGVDYVSSVTVFPLFIEEIPAESCASIYFKINTNDQWESARLNEEVKIKFIVVSEANRPDHHTMRPWEHYTLIKCEEVPGPSLVWIPQQAEGCSPEGSLLLCNQGGGKAENVVIEAAAVEGSEYVESLSASPTYFSVIPPGGCGGINFQIVTKSSWLSQPVGTKIKVQFTIIQVAGSSTEDNVGKSAWYIFKKCDQGIEVSVDATKIRWEVWKPGWYATSFNITVKSGTDMQVRFGETIGDLMGEEGSIEVWYRISGENGDWIPAPELKDYSFIIENPEAGKTVKIEVKIHVKFETPPGEYQNIFDMTICPKM